MHYTNWTRQCLLHTIRKAFNILFQFILFYKYMVTVPVGPLITLLRMLLYSILPQLIYAPPLPTDRCSVYCDS